MAPPAANGGLTSPRVLKRIALTFVAFFSSAIAIVILMRLFSGHGHKLPDWRNVVSLPEGLTSTPAALTVNPACASDSNHTNPLTALDAKYAHLADDKFTIAMQTYHRPDELNSTITALTAKEIPSLHELVIVWNNLDQDPPEDFVSKFGTKVRYRRSEQNSLNQKLLPDPAYETKAILLTDDDVYYEPDDLEFVFQSWRKFGQYRLVGALPRCSDLNDEGKWEYGFCSNKAGENHYSMILTNLCFSHIAYLDYYSSDAPEAVKIREYVDDNMNCEDIALNYMASSLAGWGPLEANGFQKYHNFEPEEGISRKPGHLAARSQCLNDFVDIFGCMPLVDETSHIVRGMDVL